ncbi:unnamed protein product, partial [Effrenium voratum]
MPKRRLSPEEDVEVVELEVNPEQPEQAEEEDEEQDEEVELDISVDENGRVCSRQGPLTASLSFDPAVRVFEDFLPPEHLAPLRRCCERFFQAKPSQGRYSSGTTFWADWDQQPRCELEALALAVLHRHCPKPAGPAGVEWWTLCLESAEVGWHWDRDYTLESSGVNLHPMLGTVTYLSGEGPQLSTMVLEVTSSVQRSGSDVQLPREGGSAWCTSVPPRPGRHL